MRATRALVCLALVAAACGANPQSTEYKITVVCMKR